MSPGTRLLSALVAAGALAAACVSAFAFSGTSLWLDEAYSALLARSGFGGIVAYLRADLGPPLYYFLLRVWVAVFGEGEAALRALSGLAYLATGGVLAWGAFRLWHHPAAAALAPALYWSSALAVRHAQSARMYALLGLWVALSLVLWLRAPREGRGAAAEALVNTLGLFTQYWFGFVLVAQALAERTVLRGRRPLSTSASLVAHGAPLLAFLTLWGLVLRVQLRSGGAGWLEPVGLSALATTFLDFYGSWIAAAAFVLFGLLIFARRERAPWGREASALLLVCLASVTLPLLISLLQPIYLVGRYTIVALPAFALLVSGLLARTRPRAGLLAVAVLVGVRLLATSGDQLRWEQRDAVASSRAAAARLLERVPGEATVLYTGLGSVTLRHYLREARTQITHPASLEKHPGWMRSSAEAERPEAPAEARALVQTLRGEIWHVHEAEDPLAAIMERALRAQHGAPSEQLPLPGSFHDTVTVYRPQ